MGPAVCLLPRPRSTDQKHRPVPTDDREGSAAGARQDRGTDTRPRRCHIRPRVCRGSNTLGTCRRSQGREQDARFPWNAEAPSLTTCPECTAVRIQGKPCGACGWRPQSRATPVVFADGDLAKVERDRSVRAITYDSEYKDKFHRGLIWIAREKAYKPGWASYKYKTKFGEWPRPLTPPVPEPPAPEVRSWVRSQDIAWARSRPDAHRGA